MRRADLEHLLRAAGSIAAVDHVVVIGSQAILGVVATPPPELAESIEADLFPRDSPELAELIDGAIGELSLFHESYGYYAHGVSPETATLAAGWRDRLVPLVNDNTRGVTGWCLSPIDIAFSKLAAGREKDLRYLRAMLHHRLLDLPRLQDMISGQREPLSATLSERLKICCSASR